MSQEQANTLVRETFENDFDRDKFREFIDRLLKNADFSKHFTQSGTHVFQVSRDKISSFERIAQFTDVDGNKIDVLITNLKRDSTIERARTSLRNFAAEYLKSERGFGKAAVLVAYATKDENGRYIPKTDWRFSYVTLETSLVQQESGKFKEAISKLTPAKRYSFLVGQGERTHTAQKQFATLLQSQSSPTLKQIEEAFSVERVTKEFYDEYEKLFKRVEEEIGLLRAKPALDKYFKENFIESSDFAKKLLGQIVFLYFLQKKGWFGVQPDGKWGEGDKRYLRKLFDDREEIAESYSSYERKSKSFFHNVLEPLFYEALASQRPNDVFAPFNAKIPFLNGGLFEPSYEYKKIFIDLPDKLFSNRHLVKSEDQADGILDIFDRYNFTVNEAERLERDVAIDPEMLGNVFENLLVKEERGQSGTYYTPQVIVSYMCRQSLLNYLATHLLDTNEQFSVDRQELTRSDLNDFLLYADLYAEHEAFHTNKHADKRFPASIVSIAPKLDGLLRDVKICDPAIGSGAFPVGLLHEIVRLRRALVPLWKDRSQAEIAQHFSSYALKRNAIENSIYGVDKEQSAVDIARLRLWLSLIVDEDDLKDDKTLPNLDYKIMQGNSLLDEYDGLPLIPKDFVRRETARSIGFQDDKKILLAKLSSDYVEESLRTSKRSIKAVRLLRDIEDLKKQIEKEKKRPDADDLQSSLLETESQTAAILDGLNEIHRRIFDEKDKVQKNKLRLQAERLLLKYINTYLDEREANLEAQIATTKDKLKAEITNVRRALKKETETPQITRLRRMLQAYEDALADAVSKRIELKKLWQSKSSLRDKDTDLTRIEIAENITLRVKPFFLWELQFGEVFRRDGVTNPTEQGFDIVIANPPYIRQEKIKEYKAAFERNYHTYSGMADILVYFYEKSFSILRDQGTLTFISSNSFLNSGFGSKLRRLLKTETTLRQVIDFAETKVFEATTETCIVVFSKSQPNKNTFPVLKWDENETLENLEGFFHPRSIPIEQAKLSDESWQLERPEVLRVIEIMKARGTPLEKYVTGKLYYGIKTGLNEAFVVDRATRNRLIKEDKSSAKVLKPFLRGRDIKRWSAEFGEQYLIRIESSSNKRHAWSDKSNKEAEISFSKTFPAIHKHFETHRKKLIRRDDQGTYFWELRSCVYWEEFEAPKIVYQDIARYFGMAWDDSGSYLANTCYFIPTNEKWLLGVLLSSAMRFYVEKAIGSDEGGFIRLFSIHVGKFPIPSAEDWQRKIIETLVDYILFLTKEDAAQNKLVVNYFESILNGCVYELFLGEELHASDKRFFEPLANEPLPSLAERGGDESEVINHVFQRLSSVDNIVRKNLYFLDNLESIRIIEEK
jgi:TaqI-like C-terminal specificity domain/Eco57I restriction-modification methylase